MVLRQKEKGPFSTLWSIILGNNIFLFFFTVYRMYTFDTICGLYASCHLLVTFWPLLQHNKNRIKVKGSWEIAVYKEQLLLKVSGLMVVEQKRQYM